MARAQATKKPARQAVTIALACSTLAGCAVAPPAPGGPGAVRGSQAASVSSACGGNSASVIGATIGTAAGILVGRAIDKSAAGMVLGGAVGGVLGGLIGRDVQQRQCELAKIAEQHRLQMVTVAIPGEKKDEPLGLLTAVVDQAEAAQFLPGSDELTPQAQVYFSKIAAQHRPGAGASQPGSAQARAARERTQLLVVGHTDDSEDSAQAAELSERRARRVARLLVAEGVSSRSIWYQGAGETLPVGDNNTPEGRALNRRVELMDFVSPEAMTAYLARRQSHAQLFRPVPSGEGMRADRDAPAGMAQAATPSGIATPQASLPVARATPPAIAQAPTPTRSPSATADTAAPGPAEGGRGQGAAAAVPQVPVPAGAPASEPAPRRSAHAAKDGIAPPERAASERALTQRGAPERVAPGINFGGSPYQAATHSVQAGAVRSGGAFSFISSALAEPVAGSCVNDRPRVSRSVKSLADGSERRVTDYLPGLYGASWAGSVNGHLVALNHVAVLRDGGAPARNPQLLIFRDWSEQDGRSRKPDFDAWPQANSYQAERGVLYRVFLDAAAPVRCIDLLLPTAAPFTAKSGLVFQERDRRLYATEFRPQVPN